MINIFDGEDLAESGHVAVVGFPHPQSAGPEPGHLFLAYHQATRSGPDATHEELTSEEWVRLEMVAALGLFVRPLGSGMGFVCLGGAGELHPKYEKQLRGMADAVGRLCRRAERDRQAVRAGGLVTPPVGFWFDPRGLEFRSDGSLWFRSSVGRSFRALPASRRDAVEKAVLEEFETVGLTCATLIVVLANSACGEVIRIRSWTDKIESAKDAEEVADYTNTIVAHKQRPPRMSPLEVLVGMSLFSEKPVTYREVEACCPSARTSYGQWSLSRAESRGEHAPRTPAVPDT